ncbi:hypothetical protein ACLB2K_024593 [Fragaria x ananassa]
MHVLLYIIGESYVAAGDELIFEVNGSVGANLLFHFPSAIPDASRHDACLDHLQAINLQQLFHSTKAETTIAPWVCKSREWKPSIFFYQQFHVRLHIGIGRFRRTSKTPFSRNRASRRFHGRLQPSLISWNCFSGSDSYSSVETDSYKRMQNRSIEPSGDFTQGASSQSKQTKGALPEGFFDNKEADLSARGIKIVKPDVKDEYKEFEKLIQEDLKEVDNRLEEEEIDAAEMIEEAESVEQKEKVKLMGKKRMELKAANAAKRRKASDFVKKEEPSHEESSSDGDSDENFAVDWRAQHL